MPTRSARARTGTTNIRDANKAMKNASRPAAMRQAPKDSRMAAPTGRKHHTAIFVAVQSTKSEEHTSELQSRLHLVCRLLLEKKKKTTFSCYTQHETANPPIPHVSSVRLDTRSSRQLKTALHHVYIMTAIDNHSASRDVDLTFSDAVRCERPDRAPSCRRCQRRSE